MGRDCGDSDIRPRCKGFNSYRFQEDVMRRKRVVRGIRGAITLDRNTKAEITRRTQELLLEMVRANSLKRNDIVSVFFTTTRDINAKFPAYAATGLGWKYVPLLCAHEMNVPGAIKKCIRILIHTYTTKRPQEIKHRYLRKAKTLRPDLVG